MANYSAVIDLRVQGQDGLRTVADSLTSIDRLVRQIRPVPTLFDRRGNAEIVAAKAALADLVRAYADGNTRVARYATSLAGLNQQMTSFKTIAANARVGSDEFTNSLKAGELASRRLLAAELERLTTLRNLYTRQASGSLTAADQGVSRMVRDLLALRNQVPNSISALNAFQRELLEVQQLVGMNTQEFRALEQAIYRLDVAMGKVQLGPVAPPMQGPALPPNFVPTRPATGARGGPPPGSLAFNPNPSQENLALGAGFPLLFGGGVGQVAGGVIGSMFGGGFGGQILGAALGQQLEDAYMRIVEIGRSLGTLNMDRLRDSVVTVNAQLDYQVEQLLKANDADSARALIAAEVYKQTGLSAGAADDAANNADKLKNAWDRTIGSLSTVIGQLVNLFIPGLSNAIDLVGTIARGWAMLGSLVIDSGNGLKGWFQNLVFGQGTAEKVRQRFGGINEETEKLKSKLSSAFDIQLRSAQLGKQLLGYEKERTNNVSLLGKLINIEVDRKSKVAELEADADQKRKAALTEYAGLTDAQSQKELAALLLLIDAEKKQGVERANLLALRQREVEINNTLVAQDQVRINAIKQQGEITQAIASANKDVMSAQLQELEQRRQVTTSLDQELNLITQIRTNKVAAANATFEATRAELQNKVAIAAAELQSVAAQKQRGFATQEQLQTAQNTYNTVVATSNEILRGATATRDAATSAADFEARMARTAAYTAQYALEAQRATLSAQAASQAYTNQLQLTQALAQATITINNAQIQTLQSELTQAKTQSERLRIINAIAKLEKENAAATLQAAYAQIRSQIEVQRLALVTAQIRYKELQAVVAIATAQGTLTREHYKALEAQAAAVKMAGQNYNTSIKIGNANAEAARAVYKAAVYAADLKARMGGATKEANAFAGAMERASGAARGISISGPQLEPWMEAQVAAAREAAMKFAPGDSIAKYYAGVNAEIKAREGFWKQMALIQARSTEEAKKNFYEEVAKAQTILYAPATRTATTTQTITSSTMPAYAAGGYVATPTVGLIGEGGEPEYIIPQSKMASAATSYLNGTRGAAVLNTAYNTSTPSQPVINITTGPVMQQNGENYVTVADMQAAVRSTASAIFASLRTPAGRYAMGVR